MRRRGRRAIGVALLDISTGEFTAAEYTDADGRAGARRELAVLRPREIARAGWHRRRARAGGRVRSWPGASPPADAWTFDYDTARRTLLAQLVRSPCRASGSTATPAAVPAAGALVQYLHDTQKADLAHVRDISFRSGADCLLIDPITLKNLEVIEASDGGRPGSLLARDRSHA